MERSRDLFVLYRGDVCLGCGTPEELEKEFGLKSGSVRYHACPSACRKYGGKGLIAVKAGKERRDEEH